MSSDPAEMSPREAMKRYLDRRRSELADDSVSTYYYRLKLWVEWCEREGITRVGDLSGWVLEQYEAHRSGEDASPSSLHNEMETLKAYVSYLERIEAVDDGLAEKVHVPSVPKKERSRDERLETDRALSILRYCRESEELYGTNGHTLLELAWQTGARLGGLRGLDLRDFDSGDQYVEFVHRPSTGTPLKNQIDGERMVGLRDPVVRAIQTYIEEHRHDVTDEFGRSPLLTTRHGRPSNTAIRTWSYQITHPCIADPCPHDQEKATCEYRSYSHASKCPSAQSPHHVRTGSISWHRDRGVPKEVTAERVNASEDVIDEYYDKSTKRERMDLRRRPHLNKLDIEDEEDTP